jgi:hypothetical protein
MAEDTGKAMAGKDVKNAESEQISACLIVSSTGQPEHKKIYHENTK